MRLAGDGCWAPAANKAVAASCPMEATVVRLAVVVCVVTAVGSPSRPARVAAI